MPRPATVTSHYRRIHRRIGRYLHVCSARLVLASPSERVRYAFTVAAATCRLPIVPERHIAKTALQALGVRATSLARLRFLWLRSYALECHGLLALQGDRVPNERIRKQLVRQGAMPEGGAIVLTIHQVNHTRALLSLATHCQPLGVFVRVTEQGWPTVLREAFGQHVFPAPYNVHSLRRSLHFLRLGGYLVMTGDVRNATGPQESVLGKEMAIPQGIAWLARQSGKPIIPSVLVPDGARWRGWVGDPVEPTSTEVAKAIEDMIRRAPAEWWTPGWLAWRAALPSAGGPK